MKTRLLLVVLGLLVALGLTACSREREDVASNAEPTVSPYLNTKHEIALDAESGIRMDDLRAMGLSFDEELRSVVFDTSGSGLKVRASTEDWKTYIFFRKKGDDTNVGYATYEYNQGERVTYMEGGVSKTKIILRPKNHIITLTGVPTAPAEGEEWYIAGITGGGDINPFDMSVSFSLYDAMGSSDATRRVPFAFGWTPATFERRGTELLLVAKPMFRPQGTIIKASVKNTFPEQVRVGGLALIIPVGSGASFHFAANQYSGSDVESGTAVRYTPQWAPASEGDGGVLYKIYYEPWEAHETKTFLIWGIPHPTARQTLTVNTPTNMSCFNTATGRHGTLLSERAMQSGKFYRLNLELRRPKIAIEYVTEYNLAGGPGLTDTDGVTPGTLGALRFAPNHNNDQSGYYNWTKVMGYSHLQERYSGPLINPSGLKIIDQSINGTPLSTKYIVPSQADLAGIFYPQWVSLRVNSLPAPDVTQVEYCKVGDEKLIIRSDYRRTTLHTALTEPTVMYALRFLPHESASTPTYPFSDGDDPSSYRRLYHKALRCAYRYRLRDSAAEMTSEPLRARELTVDVVYLGESGTYTLDDIDDPQWWSDREGQIISRVFPYTGIMEYSTVQWDGPGTHLYGTTYGSDYTLQGMSFSSYTTSSTTRHASFNHEGGDYHLYQRAANVRLFTKY